MIKQAADGHGGIFEAMRKNGILYDMQEKGIEWIFIGGVDNVLVKMVDPVLTGLMVSENTLSGGKSVVKACPEERVGVFCMATCGTINLDYRSLYHHFEILYCIFDAI